jgi:hypothetical protein
LSGTIRSIAAVILFALPLQADAAVMCVGTEGGRPQGPLYFRDACLPTEITLGNFDGLKMTFTVPLGGLNTSTDPGVPGLLERTGQSTYQTLMLSASTDPTASADIISGEIEEGSVYYHDVTLIAKTADGRAWHFQWGYRVNRIVGSPDIQIFSTLLASDGSIDPPPMSEVIASGSRRILRVYGNGQDSLDWSATVHRVKILPPGT